MFLVMKPAALLLIALLPALAFAQPSRYDLPACSGAQRELADRDFYILCYDAEHKVPLWTAHEIKPELPHVAASRPRHLRHDNALLGPVARNADYLHSGYSRGHLVPAEDMAWSGEAMRSTFLLSNTIPQNQSVNAGLWKRLESAVRSAAQGSDAAYVITGPVFDAAEVAHIGPGQVAVPTHTFKVVLIVSGERKNYVRRDHAQRRNWR